MLTLNIAAYEISHASCKTQTGDLFVLQDKKQKTETKPREKAKTKGLKSSSWQILPWPHPVVTQESTACATPGPCYPSVPSGSPIPSTLTICM